MRIGILLRGISEYVGKARIVINGDRFKRSKMFQARLHFIIKTYLFSGVWSKQLYNLKHLIYFETLLILFFNERLKK